MFLYDSTILSREDKDDLSSRPVRTSAKLDTAEALIGMASCGGTKKECIADMAVQYQDVSSPPVSSPDRSYQHRGRHDSLAVDSGYGSAGSRRNSSVSPPAINPRLGTGVQSRKVVRQAQRRKEQREETFVGLRPKTEKYTDREKRYIVRRLKWYAALHQGKQMPWEEFAADYNGRFSNRQRRLEGLKAEKGRLQGRGQFKLEYWQTRGEA